MQSQPSQFINTEWVYRFTHSHFGRPTTEERKSEADCALIQGKITKHGLPKVGSCYCQLSDSMTSDKESKDKKASHMQQP